jgi:CRISPR-associated protein Cas2
VFVAVTCECSSDDHRLAIFDLLRQYGFKMVLQDVHESTSISDVSLNRLKRDLDRVTDSFDVIRLYQFPIDGTLAITALKEKKWRRFKVMTAG